VNGYPHGKGRQKSDEFVYNGEYVNGKFNGEGELTFAVGDVYKGNFVNGNKKGPFTVKLANGNEVIRIY